VIAAGDGDRSAETGTGLSTRLTTQPMTAIAAEIINSASKPAIVVTRPPIEPSEIPRKRALLFQARIVVRRAGNLLASRTC